MRTLARPLAIAATLTLGLTGCAGTTDRPAHTSAATVRPDEGATPPVPTSSAQGPQARPAGALMVSFGDSYTAGTGTGATQPSPAAFCAQAADNYPRQVARALGMALADRSCNGARTGNIVTPQQAQGETAAAQIDGVTPDARLVTIALGVNDNGLFGTLVGCSHYTAVSTSATPCKDAVLASSPNAVDQLPSVTTSLVSAVRRVTSVAPHAQVVLLGYPQILPDGAQCPARWPITQGDAQWVNTTLAQLDSAIEAAAEQTHSRFLDLRPVTASHTACAAEPWFNGSSVADRDGSTYHPRSGYMTGVARALLALLHE